MLADSRSTSVDKGVNELRPDKEAEEERRWSSLMSSRSEVSRSGKASCTRQCISA